MNTPDLILRWLHVLSAVALVGGAIFIRLVVLPSLATLADDQRRALHDAMRRRWAKIVMLGIAVLLLTGLASVGMIASRYQLPKFYHPVLGVKILLAFVVFFIASTLAGRSPLAERFRANAKFWLAVNITLAVVVICLAGALRFAERKDKVPHPTPLLAPPATGQLAP